MPLMETVTETVTREVPQHIADLVLFVKSLPAVVLSDADLIARARAFWERQHGED